MQVHEWELRFKERIVTKLREAGWGDFHAQNAASAEYAGSTPDFFHDYPEDPEGAADECLSYWDGDDQGDDSLQSDEFESYGGTD